MRALHRVVVICGPTGSGKTSLALYLARQCGGELIAADSMQIYKGLTIGTAATTPQEAGDTPVHLTGFLEPDERFSVAAWVDKATMAIENISRRGRLPVVCGGTGLYIESLVNGIDFTEETADDGLRLQLYDNWEQQGPQAMMARLASLDPERAEKLHIRDKKRILRALEQSLRTGQTAAQRETRSRPSSPPFDTLLLGLRFNERELLYNSINKRVDAMLRAGLLDEAKDVWLHRMQYHTAAQAIGYKELFPYFQGESGLEKCVDKLKQATRNYAKRQLTWFGRMPSIHWLDAAQQSTFQQAEALVQTFLSKN